MQQLELPLWDTLKSAKEVPELADLQQLWDFLEQALVPLKTHEQLQVAGDAIAQFAGIVQERSLLTLEEIDSLTQEDGPIVPVDFFDKFVRQSMHVDFSQFIEPPLPFPRNPPQCQKRGFPKDGRSVVGVIDKAALLKALEPEPDDEVAKAKALAVAHPEDISSWVEVISHYFNSRQVESLPLVELMQEVRYPVVEEEEKERSPLIKTWLALLLGGFRLEQSTEDFYNTRGIWVWLP